MNKQKYKTQQKPIFPYVLYYVLQIVFAYNISVLNFEYFMGKCVSSPVRRPTVYSERQKVQTDFLRGKVLPRLTFHAVLSNVILRDCPYKTASPTFRLQREEFPLEPRSALAEEALKWKIQEKFDFEMTEYQLRSNVLEVSIADERRQRVGLIRINLFLIATGPYHQDFGVGFANGKTGRISFDLKISQIVAVKIELLSAQISLLRAHPGEAFSFSIKTIVGYNGSSAQSAASYPAMVLLQKREQEQSQLGASGTNLSRRKSQRSLTKQIEVGRDLRWGQQGQLPSLVTKVLSSELHNTYFQVLLWKQQGTDDTASREYFADSFVSFYKLFGTEPSMKLQGKLQLQSRSILMTEKIERYGKDCGRGTFSVNIINQPYFRQYQTSVHTEAGILRTAPLFPEEDHSAQKCQELQELVTISEAVEQNVFLLNKLQFDQASPLHIRKTKAAIEADLQSIFHLLEKTSLPQGFIYRYNSAGELLQGQKILVQLGLKISKYFQIQDPAINDVAWLILLSLIKRSEFSLSHMGFQQRQKRQIEARSTDRALNEKIRIAGIYKLFLCKLLSLALSSLNHRGSEYERTFAEVFSAYAYFRIPEFRREVLRLITRQDDPEIIEWRGVQFDLQQDIPQPLVAGGANIFSELFDWQQHFYKWLPRDEEIQSQDISLADALALPEWRERFTKRGLAFFYFLKYWVTYIQSSLPGKKDIQWRYFPGYNRLLKGFFVEMKLRPILHYPDALIESCFKLLINEKLVNPVIKILLNKVSVYDTSAVLRVIGYLNLILKSFTSRRQSLPISFNYSFLFKGLRIILQSEFAMGVSCALSLIYNHFQLFHLEFRRSLSLYLLGAAFYRLYLHWSHTVRHVFYHLITFKVYAEAHRNNEEGKNHRGLIADADILARYDELMRMMQAQEADYLRIKARELQGSLEKNYYKKMKIKAYQKMRRSRLQSCELLVGRADSQVQPHSQEIIDEARQNTYSSLTANKRVVFTEKQHSSEANIIARISNKQNHPAQEDRRSRPHEEDGSRPHEEDGQLTLSQRIIHQKQFEVQQLDPSKLKYISVYRPQFKAIEVPFMRALLRDDVRCPVIKVEMAIDNREIRPEKIDEW